MKCTSYLHESAEVIVKLGKLQLELLSNGQYAISNGKGVSYIYFNDDGTYQIELDADKYLVPSRAMEIRLTAIAAKKAQGKTNGS